MNGMNRFFHVHLLYLSDTSFETRRSHMKHVFGAVVIIVLLWSFAAGAQPGSPPAVGGQLPDIRLPVPASAEWKAYLGLSGDGTFAITDIRAKVVVIEIFSMYCPHCQREAPTVNRFFRQIEASPKYRGRVKLIGIGVGNSDFEVAHFKKTYDIPFPLFSDGDYAIHRAIGEVRTPYFIGVTIGGDGSHQIYYSQLGGPKDASKFLTLLLERSGL
jgi:peroxiredoxin